MNTATGKVENKTAVEEGTTTADSLSFKGGMRNYVFQPASQQRLLNDKLYAIKKAFSEGI